MVTITPVERKLTARRGWLLAAAVFGGISLVAAIGAHAPRLPVTTDSSIEAIRARRAEFMAGPPVEPAVPAGWTATDKDGVFYRFCTKADNCPTDGVIGDQSYWLMEFWCRDRACDLYVKGNIYNAAGQSIGWTNDTGSGVQGDKVIITLSTYMDGAASMRIDEINVR